MMFRMAAKAALAAAFLLFGHAVYAQGVIQQLGPASLGQTPMYSDSGHVLAVGGALLGQPPAPPTNSRSMPSLYAVVNPNIGFCAFSGYASATYSSLCSGFDGNGNGLLSFSDGGLGTKTFDIEINGVVYPFPGTGTGDVVGPPSSTDGHVVTFNGTTGKLLKDSGVVSSNIVTNTGTSTTGHVATFADGTGKIIQDGGLLHPAAPTTTIYLATGGTATGLDCLTVSTPCGTLAEAFKTASILNSGIYAVTSDETILAQDAGPFDGGYFTASLPGTSSNTSLFQPRIIIQGPSSLNHVVIQQPAVPVAYGLGLARGDYLLNHVTVETNRGTAFGIVAGDRSSIVLEDTKVTKTDTSNDGVAVLAFQFSQIILGDNLTVIDNTSGHSWSDIWEGELDGSIDFGSFAQTCGPNLAWTDAFMLLQHSDLFTNGATYPSCPNTGTALKAQGSNTWKRSLATDFIPGATYRFGQPDIIAGTTAGLDAAAACTHATLANGSDPWSGRVAWDATAGGTSCQVTFNVPAANTSFFTNVPACTIGSSVPMVVSATAAGSFTVAPASGSFPAFAIMWYACHPISGG